MKYAYTYDFVHEQVEIAINDELHHMLYSLCDYFGLDDIEFLYPYDGDAGKACNDLVEAWTAAVFQEIENARKIQEQNAKLKTLLDEVTTYNIEKELRF